MNKTAAWAAMLFALILLTGCHTVSGVRKDIDSVLSDPDAISSVGKAVSGGGLGLIEVLGGGGLLATIATALGFRAKAKKTAAQNEALQAVIAKSETSSSDTGGAAPTA